MSVCVSKRIVFAAQVRRCDRRNPYPAGRLASNFLPERAARLRDKGGRADAFWDGGIAWKLHAAC